MAKQNTPHRYKSRHTKNAWTVIANWWLLPTHLICSMLLAIILLARVDKRLFHVRNSDANAPSSVTALSQNDVTTLVSIAVALIRTSAGAWLTIAGWRLGFILLERTGVTAKQFSRAIHYRFPPMKSFSYSMPLVLLLWIGFLTSVPVQFVSPLLTGAVSWIPTLAMTSPEQVNVTEPGYGEWWQNYGRWPNNRYHAIIQAFGIASLSPAADFSTLARPLSRRYIPSLREYPSNSTLSEVTLPYLDIESIEWVRSEADVSQDIALLTNTTSNYNWNVSTISNISIPNPCFQGTTTGKVCPVFETSWTYDANTFPAPLLVRATQYVIVSVNGVSGPCDTPSDFGLLPGLYKYQGWSGSTQFTSDAAMHCFVFARMTYSAGVIKCKDCPLNSFGMVDISASNLTIEADPLTEQALRHMPDVLPYMHASNLWSSWRTEDNLEGYTKGMLQLAYQSSWNSLTNYFDSGKGAKTTLRRPYTALAASVSEWRVFVWLALNVLLTVSGIVVGVLQSSTRGKTINTGPTELLLLDTREVVEKSILESCDEKFGKKDTEDMQLRLRFRDGKPGSRSHPYVEVENNEYHQLPQA